jgi:hypothetical protein
MRKTGVIFVMLFLCVGCKAEMTEEPQQKIHFVKAEEEIGDRTPEERAMILKNRLKQMGEVMGTAVIVEGKTAIIGLRMKKDMEQKEVDAVKRKVDALVKSAEVDIENTSVTANDYLVGLIEEMERKRAG